MLPQYQSAIVQEQKIVAYLLSFTHRDGRGKAFFFSRFGFRAADWQEFADALKQHIKTHEVATAETTPFGIRYTIEGTLVTPDGRNPSIRTVWFIETGDSIPRFVTAYPHP